MQYAVNCEGKRVHAAVANKNEEYFCPTCGQKVIPRQGQCNVAHFAHKSACSDSWHYEMSEWHSQWQAQFPKGNREVVVEHLGEQHRADVMACGYVIEFQHSPITSEEFDERNAFYRSFGKKVVWIFDFVNEYDEGKIEWYDDWGNGNDRGGKFKWKYPKDFLHNFIPQKSKDIIVFFQLVREDHADKECNYIERVVWAIEESGLSVFKRFYTSYNYPGNAPELLEWIKKQKL